MARLLVGAASDGPMTMALVMAIREVSPVSISAEAFCFRFFQTAKIFCWKLKSLTEILGLFVKE